MSFAGYFLPVRFCMLSMLISNSRFDLVWFRLSCDHGWIRSGSVNVRKQQQQQQQLYSMNGIRVPDDGTVTFYREKLKMGFGVVHCCHYDKIYLQLIDDMGSLRLQRAIETDIQ